MKKILVSFAVVFSLLAAVFSCTSEDDVVDDITIDVPFSVTKSLDVDLPLKIENTTDSIKYPEIPVNLDLDAAIKSKFPALSIDNLKSVRLEGLSIQLDSTSVQTVQLDAIKNANLYIRSSGQEDKQIASVVNNTNASILTFTPITSSTNLLNYFKTNQNSLILEILGAKVADADMKLQLDASFKLEVGL
ncbi:MAG: hypothetical protein DI529_11240 [Chryseobacterium sp.]|nr:MAG: hypothetical protein DI529_11240 [Chryseobacterium sp.]